MTIKEQLASMQAEADKPDTDEKKMKEMTLSLAVNLMTGATVTLDDLSVLSPDMLRILTVAAMLFLTKLPKSEPHQPDIDEPAAKA